MKIRKGTITRLVLVPGCPFAVLQVDLPEGTGGYILKAEREWIRGSLEDAYGHRLEDGAIDPPELVGRRIFFSFDPSAPECLQAFTPVEKASRQLVELYEEQGRNPREAARNAGPRGERR